MKSGRSVKLRWRSHSRNSMNEYQATLKEVTDMFESCGCETDVATPSSSQVLLTVKGAVSMCPPAIFEEHVEKAKELMQSAHPGVAFDVEVKEE